MDLLLRVLRMVWFAYVVLFVSFHQDRTGNALMTTADDLMPVAAGTAACQLVVGSSSSGPLLRTLLTFVETR